MVYLANIYSTIHIYVYAFSLYIPLYLNTHISICFVASLPSLKMGEKKEQKKRKNEKTSKTFRNAQDLVSTSKSNQKGTSYSLNVS